MLKDYVLNVMMLYIVKHVFWSFIREDIEKYINIRELGLELNLLKMIEMI
jgi:hypothetical protein